MVEERLLNFSRISINKSQKGFSNETSACRDGTPRMCELASKCMHSLSTGVVSKDKELMAYIYLPTKYGMVNLCASNRKLVA